MIYASHDSNSGCESSASVLADVQRRIIFGSARRLARNAIAYPAAQHLSRPSAVGRRSINSHSPSTAQRAIMMRAGEHHLRPRDSREEPPNPHFRTLARSLLCTSAWHVGPLPLDAAALGISAPNPSRSERDYGDERPRLYLDLGVESGR